MKKIGWLVYDQAGAEYNKQYIRIHMEEGEKLGISIKLILAEEICFGTKSGKLVIYQNGSLVVMPDFVICRTIDPKLSEMFERSGIPLFNEAKVSHLANDKARVYAYLANKGIPLTDSVFVDNRSAKKVLSQLTEQKVVKAVDGHGGSQVFLTGETKLEEILQKIGASDLMIQDFVQGKHQDVRVYVIGTEIVAAVCRTAKDGFKSNFSLGGEVAIYELSEKERALTEKITKEFRFGLVGIDFLIDENGEFVFNEIEDVVGARMLYQLTDINLVERYLQYILQRIEEKGMA